jgi:excisionase family DNA binding protein
MVETKKRAPLEPRAYSITQTGQLLNRSRDTVYRLIRDGDLEAIRILGRPAVTATSIEALLKRDPIH